MMFRSRRASGVADRWGLTLGEPFDGGIASALVAPATTAQGEEAVLEVQKPHRGSEREAAALELWDGEGAVRLLAHDPLTGELGLDRERARGWTIGQTIAWSVASEYHQTHVETARWLLQAS